MEQLQRHIWLTAPHIWGNICAFPHILGSPSSYMTLQLLHSEFPYYEENLIFFFISVKEVTGPRAKGLSRLWIWSESIDHTLRREIISVRSQSYVLRLPKYWPPHPPLRPVSVSPLCCEGEDTLAGWRGGWRVNILEDATQDTALYSTYIESSLMHCTENPMYVFPEKKLRSLSHNFNIHVCICERFIYSHDRSIYFLVAE